jgi:hypothetical protein
MPSRATVNAPYETAPPSRQPRGSSGAMSRAAEPTTTILGGRRVYWPPIPRPSTNGTDVYFYELHEGDEEVFSDVVLASETELDPDEYFELVQSIRRRIQDNYEQDTLIEAIAVELERDHGFVYISDERLTAAVNVSVVEGDNFLAEIDRVDEDLEGRDADYRAVLAEFDPDEEPSQN